MLLVDDDIELMNLCAAVLKMSGASVLTAASPAEALSIMAQPAVNDVGVDVAVVDYRLPGMNGCVLADCLRVRHPELKIILYSGTPASSTFPRPRWAALMRSSPSLAV